MQFVRLSHKVLEQLKEKGYNILTSNNPVSHENPVWYPESVPDVWDYLIGLDVRKISVIKEPNILVIQDALDNIRDEDLRGVVLV
ncbi:hypothetical protein E2P86_07990 [Sphingobacterium psychroaquaticum]|uniref:hypothetical protein n=1 Tax=Sphingobacterium psychroaquaticum TaxID=561061 RepID=UPI00106BCB7B|nr:hypothetical protein [Sphingobacterium psychroaquaticum]QBQ41097.1 hypothetical protein E2P86_07990 [Sphingobacterium psychroaquaticum]